MAYANREKTTATTVRRINTGETDTKWGSFKWGERFWGETQAALGYSSRSKTTPSYTNR